MADEYIKKTDVKKAIHSEYADDMRKYPEFVTWLINAIDEIVSKIPAADVEPIVRCKDCIYRKEQHYEEHGETPYIKYCCKFTKYSMSNNDYCSFGKRTNSKRTRNLTDTETEIYNSKIESESKLTGVKMK